MELAPIQSMSNVTCAVGIVKDKNNEFQSFEISGSGVLVAPDTVVTNRHVAFALVQQQQIDQNWRKAAQFCMMKATDIEVNLCYLEMDAIYIGNPAADLAFFKIDPSDGSELFRSVVPPPVLENVDQLRLGDPVAVFGFPFGHFLNVDTRKDKSAIARVGPIMQQGHISGFQPWQGVTAIDDLLLDVRTAGGMSGSPVFFRETGTLIGLIYGGVDKKIGTASIPLGIVSRGVPIDQYRLGAWLGMLNSTEQGLLQAPNPYPTGGPMAPPFAQIKWTRHPDSKPPST